MANPSKNSRWPLRLTFFFAGTLLGILGAVATFTLLPRQYRATATLHVPNPSGAASDAFLNAQYQAILGKPTLDPVIETLQLPQKWNLDTGQCLLRIRAATSVQNARDTGEIQLHVISPNPAHAVELANAIAASYQGQHREKANLSSEKTSPPTPPAVIAEPAELASTHALPLPWLLLLAGPVAGLFLGTALALTVRPSP